MKNEKVFLPQLADKILTEAPGLGTVRLQFFGYEYPNQIQAFGNDGRLGFQVAPYKSGAI